MLEHQQVAPNVRLALFVRTAQPACWQISGAYAQALEVGDSRKDRAKALDQDAEPDRATGRLLVLARTRIAVGYPL
jgi:hypothetical protein